MMIYLQRNHRRVILTINLNLLQEFPPRDSNYNDRYYRRSPSYSEQYDPYYSNEYQNYYHNDHGFGDHVPLQLIQEKNELNCSDGMNGYNWKNGFNRPLQQSHSMLSQSTYIFRSSHAFLGMVPISFVLLCIVNDPLTSSSLLIRGMVPEKSLSCKK